MPADSLEASASYAEKHKVFQLFEGLLQDLLVSKPTDPIAHLIKALKTPAVPRVVVAGPPGVDAFALAQILAMRLGLILVNEPDIWREAAKVGTPAGTAAKALVDAGKALTPEVQKDLLIEKLKSPGCLSKGWVLTGFPANASQGHALTSSGLLPTTFIYLDVDDEELTRRLVGKRVDPEGGAVYHLEDSPPPDAAVAARLVTRPEDEPEMVEERLATFAHEMGGALSLFSSVLKRVDATTLSGEALADEAAPLVTASMPTRAPHGAPRVLLFGPPGAAAEPIARACASRYGAVCVSAVELLQIAVLEGGGKSKKIAPFLRDGKAADVPDDVIAPLVIARLSKEDVRKRGFVLVGFPSTSSQVALLSKAMPDPIRHAVYLDMTREASSNALVETRYDPLDGAKYHPEGTWPTDPDVLERLVPHHLYTPAKVAAAHTAWSAKQPGLMKALSSATTVTEDGTREPLALEERLAPYF